MRNLLRLVWATGALLPLIPAQSIVSTALTHEVVRPAGDVNGDGAADYLRLSNAFPWKWEAVNGLTGTPFPGLTRIHGGSSDYYQMVAVGDYNGDGKDDIGYFGFYSGGQSYILAGPTGAPLLSLTETRIYGGADVNGDGFADPLLIDVSTGHYECKVRSARTGATLYYAWFNGFGGVFEPYWLVLGDENGDGHADVALAGRDLIVGAPMLTTIVRGPDATPVPVSFRHGAPAGDIDRDGASDLFVSNSVHQTAILSGGSHVPIMTFPSFPAGTSSCIGLGDVDGDGTDDVAVYVLAVGSGTATVYSGATQAVRATHLLTNWTVPVATGDLDGDGRSEYATWLQRHDWVHPGLPVTSRATRRGTSGVTSSGRKPTMVTRGRPNLGATIHFDMRANEPNSLVAFAVGSPTAVLLAPSGNYLWTTLLDVRPLLADGSGLARYSVTMPTTPSLLGATASVQAATFDPAANALGLVTSNAIDLETRN